MEFQHRCIPKRKQHSIIESQPGGRVGKIQPEVEEFITNVKKDYHLDTVIFFGSRTRNDYLQNSDFDIILVYEDFEGIFLTDRISLMYKYWTSSKPLEVFCYTP
jgi:hypothetical protein